MQKTTNPKLLVFLVFLALFQYASQTLLREHLQRSRFSSGSRSWSKPRIFTSSNSSFSSSPHISNYSGTSIMNNSSSIPYGGYTYPFGNSYGSIYNDPYGHGGFGGFNGFGGYGGYGGYGGGACFPSKTKVITKDRGIIPIKDLSLNDFLLAYSFERQSNIYTPVVGWLHKIRKEKTKYLKVSLNSYKDFFYSSAYHSIALANSTYAFAKDLKREQLHSNLQNDPKKVDEVFEQQMEGIYSPITQNYNYYVLSEQEDIKILAHCFSHLQNPEKYQDMFDGLLWIWNILNEKPDYQDIQFRIHPLAKILMNYFSMALQGINE